MFFFSAPYPTNETSGTWNGVLIVTTFGRWWELLQLLQFHENTLFTTQDSFEDAPSPPCNITVVPPGPECGIQDVTEAHWSRLSTFDSFEHGAPPMPVLMGRPVPPAADMMTAQKSETGIGWPVMMFSCFNIIRMWRMLKVILFQWCTDCAWLWRFCVSCNLPDPWDLEWWSHFPRIDPRPSRTSAAMRLAHQGWHQGVQHHWPPQSKASGAANILMFQKLPLWSFSHIFAC